VCLVGARRRWARLACSRLGDTALERAAGVGGGIILTRRVAGCFILTPRAILGPKCDVGSQ